MEASLTVKRQASPSPTSKLGDMTGKNSQNKDTIENIEAQEQAEIATLLNTVEW